MYDKPLPASATPNWLSAALQIALHWAAFLAMGVILGLVLPRFARMTQEFDLPLAAPAVFAFNLSLFVERAGWYVLPILAVLDAALLLVLRACGKEGANISSLWTAIFLVGVAVLVGLSIVSVMSPMITLLQGLS
jgi:type II secretory pathway component PulF